jgi:hypothetical protein
VLDDFEDQQDDGDAYPAVVPTVNIPLHHVAVALGEVGLEPVRLGNPGAFLIAGLLVGLIMAMLGVELLRSQ